MPPPTYIQIAAQYVNAKRALAYSTERLRRAIMTLGPQHRAVHMGMTVHIHAFAAYAAAYRAYYAGRPGALPPLIGKALNQAGTAIKINMPGADADLKAFARALIDERCDQAVRWYKRNPTAKNAEQVMIVTAEAQAMNVSLPLRVRRAAEEIVHQYSPRA
jgi:hypothetical protein